MGQTGSGGIGAVSMGISEALVEMLIVVLLVVVIWKVVTLLLAALK